MLLKVQVFRGVGLIRDTVMKDRSVFETVGGYIHSDPSSRPRRLVSSGTVFISLCTLIYVVFLCNIGPFIFQVMGMGCKLR